MYDKIGKTKFINQKVVYDDKNVLMMTNIVLKIKEDFLIDQSNHKEFKKKIV